MTPLPPKYFADLLEQHSTFARVKHPKTRARLEAQHIKLGMQLERYRLAFDDLAQKDTTGSARATQLRGLTQTLALTEKLVSADQKLDELEYSTWDLRFLEQVDYGMPASVAGSEAFYQATALDRLTKDGEPVKMPSKANKAMHIAMSAGKVLAGVVTGLSINKLINPDGLYYLAAMSTVLGVALGFAALTLIERMAYKHRLSPDRRYIIGIVAVSVALLVVEAGLNWEGLINATQSLEAQISMSEEMAGLPEAPVSSGNKHYSLLAFTVTFLGLFCFLAVLDGRDAASCEAEQQRLKKKVVELKGKKELQASAQAMEEPNHIKRMREGVKPVAETQATADHARATAKLAQFERTGEQQTTQDALLLERQSSALEAAIGRYIAELLKFADSAVSDNGMRLIEYAS